MLEDAGDERTARGLCSGSRTRQRVVEDLEARSYYHVCLGVLECRNWKKEGSGDGMKFPASVTGRLTKAYYRNRDHG
jgi:hypothetical protein